MDEGGVVYAVAQRTIYAARKEVCKLRRVYAR